MADAEAVTEKTLSPFKAVKLSRVVPNDWNMNEMADDDYAKLKRGIQRLLKKNPNKIPPIIVRKHPDTSGSYQIIDGFHRWKAMGELDQKKINIFVLKADEATARTLTETLNYLRGKPNRKKQSQNIIDLLGKGMTMKELSELLPYSEDDLDVMIDEGDVTIEAFQSLQEEDEKNLGNLTERDGDEVWVDIKFKVSIEQAKVIEAELTRMSAALKGKNKRSRALEYICVNSSQCELPGDLT